MANVNASDVEAEPLSVKSDDDKLIDLAKSNKEAETAETDDNKSDNDVKDFKDDDTMIALSEKEDRVMVDEMIQERRAQIDVESSKVIDGKIDVSKD